MLNKKKLFLLTTLILLFIGTVNASELSNDTFDNSKIVNDVDMSVDFDKSIVNEDNYQKSNIKTEKTVNNETIQTKNYIKTSKLTSNNVYVSNYDELLEQMEIIRKGSEKIYTINLQPGNYNVTRSIRLYDSSYKKIIINGNNNILDGKIGQDRHEGFIILGSNGIGFNQLTDTIIDIELNNVTLKNFNSTGESIIDSKGNLTIKNCIFQNNKAHYGIIDHAHYLNLNVYVDIINCTFEMNYNNVINNYKNKPLNIVNSRFINNLGGAIYGDCNLTNCTLNNNGKISYGYYNVNRRGGAIYGDCNLTNCTLNNNQGSYGGAIYSNISSKLVNCTLNNNSAGYGGAIYVNGSINLINCTLNNNQGDGGRGGAIYINKNTNNSLINCTLNNNYASIGGAINNGYLIIKNTIIQNNKAEHYGGAISYCEFNMTNSILQNNTAGKYGGAIYNPEKNTLINNSTLNNNQAGKEGGVIYIDDYSNLTITNSELNNNNATTTGGAIYIRNNINLTITNSILQNNTAGKYGGAIYVGDYSNLTITNSKLNNNNATTYGGAIYNNNSLNMTNSILQNNTAGKYGGAIFNNDSLNVTNSILQNNTAEQYGGAIYNNNSLNITSSGLLNNEAARGGAIYNIGNDTNIINNIFQQNRANITGKAIRNTKNTILSNNTNADTSKYNGTIYTTGINVQIKNNVFYDGIIFINSMNVLNGKYVLTTKITNENYTKLNIGRVSYTLDGKWIGSINVVDGTSWISFNTPSVGNHTIIATYMDVKGMKLSSDSYTFEKKAKVNVLWNAYNVKNDKVIIVTIVKDDKGNNINSGRVSYRVNNKWIGSIDVKKGSSWISFNYNDTTVTFKATYISNDNITQNIYIRELNLTKIKFFANKTSSNQNKSEVNNSTVHIMINSINVINGKYVLTTKTTDNNYNKMNIGRVSYTLDGKWIGSINVNDGSSWISFDVPGLGNHTIVAKYIDANGKTITNDTYSFEKKSTVSGVNAVFSAYNIKNGKVIIITTVKNDKSDPINSGRISYTVNGKWIGSIDVKNGSSWISFNYTNTTITFKATFITNSNVTQNIYTRTLDLNEMDKLIKVY